MAVDFEYYSGKGLIKNEINYFNSILDYIYTIV